MKSLKEYFNMVVTAVICLAMSLIPGKNRGKVVKVLSAGGTFSGNRFLSSRVGMDRITGYVSAARVLENNVLSDMGRKSSYDTCIKIQRMTEKELFRKRKIRADTLPRHVSLPSVGPGDREMCQTSLNSNVREICQSSLKPDNREICRMSLKPDNREICPASLKSNNGKIIRFPSVLYEEKVYSVSK